MPCGGIYPLARHWAGPMAGDSGCWVCHKSDPPPDLFCEEWDTYLHSGACLVAFLHSEEGQIVITHGHDVIQGKDQ